MNGFNEFVTLFLCVFCIAGSICGVVALCLLGRYLNREDWKTFLDSMQISERTWVDGTHSYEGYSSKQLPNSCNVDFLVKRAQQSEDRYRRLCKYLDVAEVREAERAAKPARIVLKDAKRTWRTRRVKCT